MTKGLETQTPAEGSRHRVFVTDMSAEGWGIAKLGRLAVFLNEGIPAIPGDDVMLMITKLGNRLAYGKVEQINKPSPQRRESACQYSEDCGGCALQIMDYQGQLQLKRRMIETAFQKIGKIENPLVRPMIGMEEPLRYRNKAQFPAGPGGQIGFYQLKSHKVVDCQSCMIQSEAADKAAQVVRDYIQAREVSSYDTGTGIGLLRHVIVRVGDRTGEVMVILVVNQEFDPDFRLQGMPEALREEIDSMQISKKDSAKEAAHVKWRLKSVVANFHPRRTSQIMGERYIVLYGEDRILDVFDGKTLEISPHSFFQVNTLQTKALYDTVVRYAGLTGAETVVDAYCGVGGIGMSLAPYAARVIGIELNASAVDDARRNAQINNITNIEFLCERAERALPELRKKGVDIHAAILDPPAKGCDQKLLESLAEAKVRRVVYVSCNPATLARDLRLLQELGFVFKEAQPVDMFPQTMSVECVAWLQYKGAVSV